MDPIPLTQIAEMCGGCLVPAGSGGVVSRISKDTRTIQTGDLYIALRGENFDGNEFVPEAAAAGAAAVITERKSLDGAPPSFPRILVDDSLEALRSLAKAYRDRLNLRAVCITGSSGKTSTKEFTAAVLSSRYRVSKTIGNLNNQIGLPLTILEATSAEQAAVWEIGMNHVGETARLAKLARPDAAIITNIGVAHIEYMGSREAIAKEKSALVRSVSPDGVVIVPAEDSFADFLASQSRARVVRAGLTKGDVTGAILEIRAGGSRFVARAHGEEAEGWIPSPGEHMVRNALLAIAAGIEFGLSLEDCIEGLSNARIAGGRLQHRTIRGVRIIDDSYNANPDSVEAALATLAAIPTSGRRIAVLGRMGELGSYAEAGYRRVGQAAARTVDSLITVGAETAVICSTASGCGLADVHQTRDNLEAARLLRELSRENDLVLVKGSRSARMEHVIGGFED